MNILFLSTENPYPPDHGHHIRTLHILKALAKSNTIYFIGFAKTADELDYANYLREFCASVDIFLAPYGALKLQFALMALLNLFSRKPLIAQRYLKKPAINRIKGLVAEKKIDLLHYDMLHLSSYSEKIQFNPIVVTNHNVESLRLYRWYRIEKNLLLKPYLLLQYKKLLHFEKKMCPKFDKCIVVSKDDRDLLLSMCHRDNFTIIPNGVDSEFFKPGREGIQPNSLIWTGGMDDPHNRHAVNYFLERILPLIRLKLPEVKVMVIGRSPTAKLLREAKENPNIEIKGFVEDIRPYLNRAAVFIAPLSSGSGTKIKVLNALSQAKAVITTTVGAEGIEVTNNENIIIADDPRQFADKVLYLLRNPVIAKRLGEKGRELITRKYDWKVIEKDVNALYESIVLQTKGNPAH